MIDLHADDYGYSINTSKEILECINKGYLDSISVMVGMNNEKECFDMLYKEIPSMPFLPKMSVHLNLVEKREDGFFPTSWIKLFLLSYSLQKENAKKKLKEEIKKQIVSAQNKIDTCISIAKKNKVKVNQSGIRIDSHVHTHLIPIVWESLIEVIKEENFCVEYIRNPKEPLMPFLLRKDLWSSYSITNIIKNRILMFYSNKVDRYYSSNNLDKMYMCGLTLSGKMDNRVIELYSELVNYSQKKHRTIEFLFHPGISLKNEYSTEKNEDYFRNANSSPNRLVEKETLRQLREVITKNEE